MSKASDDLALQAVEAGEAIGDDVEIDLSEAITYEPFDADNVPVRVVAAKKKIGKKSKAPYIQLRLEVEAGEHKSRTLWTNINLTGKGAGIGFDSLEALGATDKAGDLVTRDNPRVNPDRLVGLHALVNVRKSCQDHEVDENGDGPDGYKPKAEVKKFKKYVSPEASEAANLK